MDWKKKAEEQSRLSEAACDAAKCAKRKYLAMRAAQTARELVAGATRLAEASAQQAVEAMLVMDMDGWAEWERGGAGPQVSVSLDIVRTKVAELNAIRDAWRRQ